MMRPALSHCLLKALSGFPMHTQAWCPDNVHARWENTHMCIHTVIMLKFMFCLCFLGLGLFIFL